MDNSSGEAVVPYLVRRSARAKRLIMKVDAWGGVEVVVPHGVHEDAVILFVAGSRDWLQRARQRVVAGRVYPVAGALCPEQIVLPALGESWTVHVQAGSGNRCKVDGHQQMLRLTSGDDAAARLLLQNWLQRHAVGALVPWLQEVSIEIGIDYSHVGVRSQKTRWGSCSRRGHISLNRNLLFLSPDVVRYLFVHELCHIRHPNHSARYWSLVRHFMPDYPVYDRILRRGWEHVPRWAWPG